MHSRSDLFVGSADGGTGPVPTHSVRAVAPRPDEMMAPATQIVGSRADYLGENPHDIGQRIAPDRLEMFVGTDPAQALLQALAERRADFIALHDVGASTSLRLVQSIAGALDAPLQQLAIRRQGHGVPLATLRFVEIAGQGQRRLRVYSTDVDADTQARRQLAHVLLGHARLAVLLVGALPPHALASALQPLADAMRQGPWPGRDLLVVPLTDKHAMAGSAAMLGDGTGVNVMVADVAAKPNEAWSRITGTWNRLRDGRAAGSSRSAPAGNAARAPGGRAMAHADVRTASPPASPAAAPATAAVVVKAPKAAPENPLWARYLTGCHDIKGLVSACLFDFRSVQLLGHTGARPDPDRLVTQGLALFNAMADSGRALGLGASQPDAAISLTGHHLLLHPLPGHPGILLHAVLDGSIANLTLARMQLQRVDGSVLGAKPGH